MHLYRKLILLPNLPIQIYLVLWAHLAALQKILVINQNHKHKLPEVNENILAKQKLNKNLSEKSEKFDKNWFLKYKSNATRSLDIYPQRLNPAQQLCPAHLSTHWLMFSWRQSGRSTIWCRISWSIISKMQWRFTIKWFTTHMIRRRTFRIACSVLPDVSSICTNRRWHMVSETLNKK